MHTDADTRRRRSGFDLSERSAPVPGRRGVAVRDAAEKWRALGCRTLLCPRTGILDGIRGRFSLVREGLFDRIRQEPSVDLCKRFAFERAG